MKMLDVVALIEDLADLDLVSGQAGAIIDELAGVAFELEFIGEDGHTIATAAIGGAAD